MYMINFLLLDLKLYAAGACWKHAILITPYQAT